MPKPHKWPEKWERPEGDEELSEYRTKTCSESFAQLVAVVEERKLTGSETYTCMVRVTYVPPCE